jgi:TPP-dependent pyruvate/acetoin dehydrogenase alpha subunit
VRAGGGPAFLELQSLRFASHSTNARETRGQDEMTAIRAHCPIGRFSADLAASGKIDAGTMDRLRLDVDETVSRALAFADASPLPTANDALTDVW